jgi:murein DD-endopeptidase MepM/ murein hydrolase activator NlpD
VIDVGGGRYLMMGHLREGSIKVNVGERVGEGQRIARVGNSGNTSAPHIHSQSQTLPTAFGDMRASSGTASKPGRRPLTRAEAMSFRPTN